MTTKPNETDRDGSNNNERLSLLDTLNNKNQVASRKTILHRIILVGKLRNFPNKTKLGEHYDRMFRNQQQQQQNNQKHSNPFHDKVTGMIIIYPTVIFHIIESSLETIKGILREVETMQDDPENGWISEARIISFAHEVHIRIFPLYAYKVMNLTSESDSNEPGDTIEALISEITTKLIRLGKFLNDSAKGSQFKKEFIDNLHEQHPDFLPNQNYASHLLKCDQLWSIQEYLDYYEKPFNVVLESDLTWPAPSKLFPYS